VYVRVARINRVHEREATSSGAGQRPHKQLLSYWSSATALLTVVGKNGGNRAVINEIDASRKLPIAVHHAIGRQQRPTRPSYELSNRR